MTTADGGLKAQLCVAWRGSINQHWKIGTEDFSDLRDPAQQCTSSGQVQVSRLCAVPLGVLLDIRIIWHVVKGRK